MSHAAVASERDFSKWAFFALMAACTLLVIYVDEKFLIVRSDPEWRHIAAFKWLLLPHGLAGATALLTGPLQFSDKLRAASPKLHRWTGRIYIAAVCCVAAPMGMYIGVHFEPRAIYIEQYFQAGLWWLTTATALACILTRRIAMHKIWMMRSYGFCLVFVLSRVPDAFTHMSDQVLSDVLWSLVIAALIVPDFILLARDFLRTRRRAMSAQPIGAENRAPTSRLSATG
jgi:hypothetical protein